MEGRTQPAVGVREPHERSYGDTTVRCVSASRQRLQITFSLGTRKDVVSKIGCVVVLVLLLASGVASSQTKKVSPAVVTPPPAGNSFKAFLSRTYTETSTKDEGDGVTTFVATIPNPGGPTDLFFAERDAFRKLTFFTSSISQFGKYERPALVMYVSVPDCKAPVFILRPRTFMDHWFILNRVAILADDELLLDQPLANFKLNRETYPGGLEETVDVALTSKQIADLRRLATAKKVSVRITGQKGYVSLGAVAVASLKKDVPSSLRLFDAVSRMVDEKKFDPC
jgi:hypothetical protein